MTSTSSRNSRTAKALLWSVICCVLYPQALMLSQDGARAEESDAADDSRLSCPPEAKVDEAVALIRAAYEAAYDNAKDTGEPDPLIEQLTSLANQTTDSAKKYALLSEAEAVATQYENYASALDILAKRAEQFQIDGLKLKGQLLKRLAGPKVAADLVLFDQASETAEQAVQVERFDVAAEAASLALSVAKAVDREQKAEARKRGRSVGKVGKDEAGPPPVGPGLVKKATALQSRVTASQKLFAEYGEAVTDIKSQPDDAAANSVVAKYLCFVRGDWQKGLPALAKSDLKGLKEVAAKEVALLAEEKRDAKRVFDLAGAWWSASESKGLTEDQQSAVKDHSACFYADVVESLSDVLEKQLAKSRLRGLSGNAGRAGRSVVMPDHLMPAIQNSIGITLKLIPAGTFQMGSNDGDPDEKPVHEVRITQPYYIGAYEVTNAQWKAVMMSEPSRWKDDNRPVEQVSWEEAVEFCRKLSALPEERAAGRVYRLPTEAEWEYACRAGMATRYCFGDDESALGEFSWFSGNAGGQTHPVGQKKPNKYGLYDMHGNVWEWCSDRYGSYSAGVVADPQGTLEGSARVHRGGCWHDPALFCRSASRWEFQTHRNHNLGFRVALRPSRGPQPTKTELFLSDLPAHDPVTLNADWPFSTQGQIRNEPISVRGIRSPKGLGMHPPESGSAQVTYEVPKGTNTFKADAAINDTGNAVSPLTFRVVSAGDGRLLWKSPSPLQKGGASVPCIADVNGVNKITLYVDCPGSPNWAHAVWIEPRFIQDSVGNGNVAGAIFANVMGIKFVYVPQGTFRMGSPQSEEGRFAGENLVNVTISRPFLISQTEVTQSQWKQLMASEPWKGKPFVKEGDNYPASHISWEMANEFCNRLTEREHLAGRVPNERYTMPTEAQWEYACRAGTQTAYSFGDDKSLLGDYAWWGGHECGGNSRGQEYGHEVATKKPNPWGIYDMHGNMWEWCSDYAAGDQVGGVDPKGPSSGPGRILRGGGWPECPTFLRSANRTDGGPAVGNFGVRVIRVAEPAAPGQAQPDPGRLTGFRGAIGKTIAFNVTGAANGGGVWGSNPYTADSQLARAAVHAGVLRPGESGIVRVTVLPGQQTYDSVLRNGVMSGRWGAYGLSYRIEPNATPTGGSANTKDSEEWTVLFRSDDPSFWNKEMAFKGNYAIPLAEAPVGVRFLRMKRVSSGATVIIPMSNDKLVKNGSVTDKYGWAGANDLSWGGHKLGIYDLRTRGRQGGTDAGEIAVFVDGFEGHQGWGFGNKVDSNDRQYFSWEREEVSKSVFEVAVKASDLTPTESQALLGN
jgi:formylglycine-generating enzyme required for sulfatase activity